MTPKKVVQWTIAVLCVFGAIFFMMLTIAFLIFPNKFFQFDVMVDENLFHIEGLILLVISIVVPTFILFLFGSTRGGQVELSALGMKMKGPSGPIILWCLVFILLIIGGTAIITPLS